MKVSQVQDKILQSSRTLEVKRSTSKNKIEKDQTINTPMHSNRKVGTNLSSYSIAPSSNP